jgi:hypothetical protein
MEVPTVDHTTLEDQAGKVDREATRIRTEAQRLISTNQVWGYEQKTSHIFALFFDPTVLLSD